MKTVIHIVTKPILFPLKSVTKSLLFPYKSVTKPILFPHKSVIKPLLFPHKSVIYFVISKKMCNFAISTIHNRKARLQHKYNHGLEVLKRDKIKNLV